MKFITTTLPYINSNPHIGHALELVQADTITRFYKWYHLLETKNIHFNSGLDENGIKVYRSALKNNLDPQEYCDKLSKDWKNFYTKFNINIDSFYRTTDESHKKSVQKIWEIIESKGDIYKKEYSSKYCVGCEEFKRDIDLINGKCKDHPNLEIEDVSEENYFFKLSKYKDQLLNWYKKTEGEFLIPTKHNKELKHFIVNIEDISISRNSKKVPWGVGVPNDKDQTIYVWFDALLNYILSAGYLTNNFNWSDTLQLCGVDNLRFQAVIFQGLLCSLEIKNTNKLLVHGTVLDKDGSKMSKSVGNVVCPIDQINKYNIESVRYYLIAGNSTFSNFKYDETELVNLYNTQICNGYGNLVKRVLTLINKKNIDILKIANNSFTKETDDICKQINDRFLDLNLYLAYDLVSRLVTVTNKYLNDNKPWDSKCTDPDTVLKNCFYNIEWISHYYSFIFPSKENEIFSVIDNLDNSKTLFEKLL